MDNYFTTQNKELCCGCTACASVCPVNCISMQEDERGFSYPVIDKNICIGCLKCEKVCPFATGEKALNPKAEKCYALTVDDDKLRFNSASGGAFTAIKQAYCDDNTVIIGSEMCGDLKVRHTAAYSVAEAAKFRKSKYVRSDTNGMYTLAKKSLEEGKKVLYTGTGCQIAGLKGFLQKDYDNLLTVDFVCHGVPSQKMFDKYIEYLEKKYKDKVVHYDFRCKIKHSAFWENISFKHKTSLVRHREKNLFLRAFLNNLFLMPSCYACKFARNERAGDITIADFWGIQKYTKDFDTSKGVSLVIVNNDKGKEVFDKVENVKLFETDLRNAVAGNGCLNQPTRRNPNYDKFMNLAVVNFPNAVKKYCKPGFKTRVKRLSRFLPEPAKKAIKKVLGRG